MRSMQIKEPANRAFGIAAITVVALLLTGCSGDSAETVATDPPAATTEAPTTGDGSAPETTATEAPTTTQAAAVALTLEDVFPPITTQPTEPGPRPLLAWDAVAGADIYEVVVLGADGQPYWAWSGADTAINVGGTDEPLAVGAWVHEEMSWTVSAHGATGEVLALSAPAQLQP